MTGEDEPFCTGGARPSFRLEIVPVKLGEGGVGDRLITKVQKVFDDVWDPWGRNLKQLV